MSDPNEAKGTPVTQEWVLTLLLGYFIGGPLLMAALFGIAAFVKWIVQ